MGILYLRLFLEKDAQNRVTGAHECQNKYEFINRRFKCFTWRIVQRMSFKEGVCNTY